MATERQTMQRLRRKALAYYTAAAFLRTEPDGRHGRTASKLTQMADAADSEAMDIGKRLDPPNSGKLHADRKAHEIAELTELLRPMGDRS